MLSMYPYVRPLSQGIFRILMLLTLFVMYSCCWLPIAHAQASGPPGSYRLLGTIEGRLLSGAVIADPTGVQLFYKLHDKLPDGSTIVQVRDKGVSLKGTDGMVYDLYITSSAKTASSAIPDLKSAVPAPYATGSLQDTTPEQQPKPRLKGRRGRTPQLRDDD